ncbi:MAG: NAD(P)-binding domain-containing protein, partial [Acidobacteria bacterium]|nr:NAD(P)-binding domain-containing protein [Acidobacteriota bacterium]
PRKLNVPGEDQAKVAYQLLDAFQYQNEHVLVVGGGDSAIEAAMALAAQTGNQVTLSYRKTKFFRIKRRNEERIYALLEKDQLRVQFESNVLEIGSDFVLLETPQGPLRLANDRVFIFAGGTPPFDLLKSMGIAFGAASV